MRRYQSLTEIRIAAEGFPTNTEEPVLTVIANTHPSTLDTALGSAIATEGRLNEQVAHHAQRIEDLDERKANLKKDLSKINADAADRMNVYLRLCAQHGLTPDPGFLNDYMRILDQVENPIHAEGAYSDMLQESHDYLESAYLMQEIQQDELEFAITTKKERNKLGRPGRIGSYLLGLALVVPAVAYTANTISYINDDSEQATTSELAQEEYEKLLLTDSLGVLAASSAVAVVFGALTSNQFANRTARRRAKRKLTKQTPSSK